MSEDENKSCLWGRQRYINKKKKKKKRIVWYHWYWYNNYWKTTYQGNLNCFFLCFVSLHSLRIFYTSFSSLDHIDGSASQTHVFISLSKLLPAPHHNNNKNRALLCCHFSHGKNLLNWDLRLSCRVLSYRNAKKQRFRRQLHTAHTCSVSLQSKWKCHGDRKSVV